MRRSPLVLLLTALVLPGCDCGLAPADDDAGASHDASLQDLPDASVPLDASDDDAGPGEDAGPDDDGGGHDDDDGGRDDASAPEPAAPVIANFTASPATVDLQAPTPVTWTWSYEAPPSPTPTCTLDPDVGVVASGESSTVLLLVDTTFTLTCENDLGSDTAEVQIGTQARPWTAVATGANHTCGIKGPGELYCWGAGGSGQLGNGGFDDSLFPARIGALAGWTDVDANGPHTCGIRDGELYCWGWNAQGQLGIGAAVDAELSLPLRVGDDADWVSVTTGDTHTCALKGAGELWCWGMNGFGQLGDGTLGPQHNKDVPVRVGQDADWRSVVAGTWHTCGVKGDGELYCWGHNAFRQLGAGGAANLSTPTRVGTDAGWLAVSAGSSHTCGVRAGELYCWGAAELGDGTSTLSPTPLRIGDASDWSAVDAGAAHTCGVRGGQLFCWGSNASGQLGDGSTADRRTPTQVGGDGGWDLVAAGGTHTCGIRGGELSCWGFNEAGQLGLNEPSYETSPARVGTDADWSAVSSGANHSCGLRGRCSSHESSQGPPASSSVRSTPSRGESGIGPLLR